jgi:hypothetical protein
MAISLSEALARLNNPANASLYSTPAGLMSLVREVSISVPDRLACAQRAFSSPTKLISRSFTPTSTMGLIHRMGKAVRTIGLNGWNEVVMQCGQMT